MSKQLRLMENYHILLWLFKDISWMMEFRVFGTIMIIPTLLIALYILYKSKEHIEFWVNLAVLFWIAANSTWMLIEFFKWGDKLVSLPFFILGLISFFVFVYKSKANSEIL
jgi:hypothetical protein